jgi:hypothetical protein
MRKWILIAALALIVLGLAKWRFGLSHRPETTVASHAQAKDTQAEIQDARASLQLLYDAEAQGTRATRVIEVPRDCRACTNDAFTLTKTIDTITLHGDRAAVTVADRTSITAKREQTGKAVVIENVVVTKEEWERDAQGKWDLILITPHSFQRFEDGKLIEKPIPQ